MSDTTVSALLTGRLHAAADYIDAYGWTQGREQDDRGRVCLTGAVRLCAPQTGDEHILRQVLRRRERAEGWNDDKERTAEQVTGWLRTAEVTDADLRDTFGPQWQPIVTLIRRTAALTDDEGRRLAAAQAAGRDAAQAAGRDASRDARRNASWDARRNASWDASRDASWDALRAALQDAGRNASWAALWDALQALHTRDLVGKVFTADHYRILTGPWAAVIGPVHPDDPADGLIAPAPLVQP